MPYTHKKVGSKYAVYKAGKKVGETKGTKQALNKYLAALHIADKKETKKEVKALNENMNEVTSKFESELEFYVVEHPESPTENPQMLVHKSDPFMFARQVIGGLRPEQVYGFYLDENDAINAAHDLVDAVYESAKNLETKKDTVIEKLNKHINKLQKEINMHMKSASDNPQEADQHHTMAERKMAMIKEMRNKHKMVEAAKQQLPEKNKEQK